MPQNITKVDQAPLANITKINGVTIDADDSPASGEIRSLNGSVVFKSIIPTGLIVPYTGGAGGAPSGWSIYNSADGYYIIGAGDSFAVDASSAGVGAITAPTDTTGGHTGSTAITLVAERSGGRRRYYATAGDHAHNFTLTAYTPPYQECYLIKAGVGESEFPANAIVFTYGVDKSSMGTNIWTDGYMFRPNAAVGTGGSNSLTGVVSDSAGNHVHGSVDSGTGSGQPSDQLAGAHTHTENFVMTNNLWKQVLAAWRNASAAVQLGTYGSNIIGMYESTTPPAGWYLCDGNNGTPNLQDYFIKCDTNANAGTNEGTGQVTALGSGSLTHGTHEHTDPGESGFNNGQVWHSDLVQMDAHSQVNYTNTAGSWYPEYYALAFIMYGG